MADIAIPTSDWEAAGKLKSVAPNSSYDRIELYCTRRFPILRWLNWFQSIISNTS
jgi:hypothetical protein